MRTTLLSVLLATGLTAGLTACSSSDADPGGDGDKLAVGVMFPGNLSDDGFMQSGHEGYQRIEESLADEVTLSKAEQVPDSDYQQVLTRLASTSDLVVSFGGQTDAVVREVAPSFPDVKFVEIGGPSDAEPLDNLAYYDPTQAQGGYLSGTLAALSSKTGKVAFVGGIELPAIVQTAEAFAAGAKAAVPGIEVLDPQYVGDFNDVAKAKQAGLALIAAGADVLGQQLNLGHQGLAQAAVEQDALVVGGPLAKECGSEDGFVGYVKEDTGAELEHAVRAVLDGTYEAAQVPFGVGAGDATDIVACTDDAEVLDALESAKAGLASGAITP
ncbi:BMP family ABC transporter substrate-binding protein [Nocardioides aromaticivorans]|uniref:BMP family ABC transporter substrate-binding protein n=1 Tax=Nocardioides aromaticivorans TaxID=200618 RepID=A0ABX7PMX8_9ACTN|nr:BMP family ABC transporter substrate-binding protein [Nocardioides aromaticivorans]QSR27281.1 BMP family ABC transporter substrate-binding protein [Nocardioides aromaticivorans]